MYTVFLLTFRANLTFISVVFLAVGYAFFPPITVWEAGTYVSAWGRLAAESKKLKTKIVSFKKAKPVLTESAWQLEKDANGVQIYVKAASASAYRQVKAVTRVHTSMSGMIALIKDDAASPRWMDRIVKFETIRKITNQEWYTYAEIGIPWPFKNADLITRNLLEQSDKGIITIRIENTPDFVEKYKDKARVLRAGGGWTLTPQKESVLVEYIFHAKPEGLSLPAWLVNSITIQSFHRSIERMRRLAETDKYKTEKLPYIR